MTDEKRKPGRPRKWASDAERMRGARAATRVERLADEERREVERADQERANREQFASSPNAKPLPSAGVPKTGNTWKAVHATCEANILKLRDELRELENEYDDSVYDRWILEHQYRMAVARVQEHDPTESLGWTNRFVAGNPAGGLPRRPAAVAPRWSQDATSEVVTATSLAFTYGEPE